MLMLPTSWEYWEVSMIKRILCCVETTKQADTDYQYIRETIRQFYIEPSNIVIRPVYMESKSRYNSRSVQEQIRKQTMNSTENSVIYFIDTDDWDVSADDQKLLKQIQEYCTVHGYDFVFFCKDVEDVYLGRRKKKKKKVSAIKKFKSTHAIETVEIKHLEGKRCQTHYSNIMNVLDKYWVRK